MTTLFNLPQYRTVIYRLNPETGYYTKTAKQVDKMPLMRLPYEIRVTPTQVEKIKCNATELIVSRHRFKNGATNFLPEL